MNTTKITESQVTEWMLARLSDVKQITPRGSISIEIKADNFNPGIDRRVKFRIYHSEVGHTQECDHICDVMESFRTLAGKISPAEKVRDLRKRAASLLSEADEIESSAPNQ